MSLEVPDSPSPEKEQKKSFMERHSALINKMFEHVGKGATAALVVHELGKALFPELNVGSNPVENFAILSATLAASSFYVESAFKKKKGNQEEKSS